MSDFAQTPYEFLIETRDYIAYIEKTKAQDTLSLALLRVGFLENYLDYLIDPIAPLQFPDGQAKLAFHLDLLRQAEQMKKNLKEAPTVPKTLPEYCAQLCTSVAESLDCQTTDDLAVFAENYRQMQHKQQLPTTAFSILTNVN